MKIKSWKKLFAPHIPECGGNCCPEGAVADLDRDGGV